MLFLRRRRRSEACAFSAAEFRLRRLKILRLPICQSRRDHRLLRRPCTACVCLENEKNKRKVTKPDTRHNMRLICVLFTLENNTGHTDGRTDGPTDLRTYGRSDTTSYRDATAHLKTRRVDGKVGCTLGHNRKTKINSHPIIHCPTSSGAREQTSE